MEWETVIGLEVHVQLSTASKLFSGAATAYGAPPNTQACAVDLALPGVLPVLNAKAVAFAMRLGLSIQAQIDMCSQFARKNYFYPDLPKGYQISQFDRPIVHDGYLDIDLEENVVKRIRIERAHLEEDAGKSLHEDFHGCTGIDLNRAGTPLLEIVSAPDMRSAKEAVTYLKTLHNLVRYLGISDGNMQEGSFRCDVNVSLCPKGHDKFGTRAEIKNLNSFRFIERAIAYEVERQADLLEQGKTVVQETRLYDPDRDETRSLRSKENAHDYRYFPDPDLLPVHITAEMLAEVRNALPELPWEKRARFKTQYGLNDYDARGVSISQELAAYFESVIQLAPTATPKMVANWMNGDLAAAQNREGVEFDANRLPATDLAQLLERIADKTLSSSTAKTVFEALWNREGTVDAIIEAHSLKQITDTGALATAVDKIIAANPGQVAEYRGGKDRLFAFFVGQVMKETRGKANPEQVNTLLQQKLGPSAGT
ncbi:MAG: aspartyl/glutamyl-tRNA amidotransferase subunit B [Gammaproteobacteria bacterium RIFCSPHIGHO2_12_FULL_45_9]|nr:MAG: aspartyl/glutamyl-tRNA amidotransferase subunit B [Gammaproteobacteria bacterium RIFCSPHIGHO2_12_FULL_45_9]